MECKHFEFLVTHFLILYRPWTVAVELFENPAALRGISNEASRVEESSANVYPVHGILLYPVSVMFAYTQRNLNFKC